MSLFKGRKTWQQFIAPQDFLLRKRLMRHKSYATTQRYINMAGQLSRAADKLYVPALPAVSRA